MDYKDSVYKIIGAAMEVHRQLGWGLLESVYQEALSMELDERGVSHECEKEIEIFYKNKLMEKKFRLDIVAGDIIIELKSVEEIRSEHRLQLFNHLRLTHKKVGLLINFGEMNLHGERYMYDSDENICYRVDKDMNPVDE
jgi:GxxExxY protein